jgi:enamine deaminase RidA (YjgF/YER057c/UK114 family)
MDRKFISPPGTLQATRLGFSQVVRVDNASALVYVAGQGPVDPQNNLIGAGDFEAQARATFEHLKQCLEQAGASFDDVIKMNVFLLDIKTNQWPFRKVRAEYINTANPPVSTMVEVTGLAVEGMMVEVEVVAALP